MNNLYRMAPEEICESCLQKDHRIHEVEAHDRDVSDLQKYAVKLLAKLMFIGATIVGIGGGAAMIGIKLYYEVQGIYGEISAVMAWALGAFMFVSTIYVAASYVDSKDRIGHRLVEIRELRRLEIRERHAARDEQRRKERQS